MRCDTSFLSALLLGTSFLLGMPAKLTTARAQGLEIEAEADWRVLREQRVYDITGSWIGKVDSVSVREEQIVVTVRLRRSRSRRLIIPLSALSDNGGKLTLRSLLAR